MNRREMDERLKGIPDKEYGVIQGHRVDICVAPRKLIEAAYIGYDVAGHAGGQTLKKLQQRGGFGLGEALWYLCYAIMSGRVRIEFDEDERELLDKE